MPRPARNCGGSTAKRTSSVRSCRAAAGSCAAPRSGATATSCACSSTAGIACSRSTPRTASRFARSATPASVSLTDGLPRISDITHATQSSPPVVYRDLVIVGSQVPDRVQLPDPMGYVQAFNARTGKRVWAFSVDSAVGEGSRRRDVGERIVAEERPRQRVGADGARRRRAACSICRRRRRAATTTAAGGRAPTCSPSRWSVSTPPPAR